VERPEPPRARPAHPVGRAVRPRACDDRVPGAADELPPVPPRPVAVDAQRDDRRVQRAEAGPAARGRPVAVPADRGVDGLGDAVLPGAERGPDGRPARGGRCSGGAGRGGRRPARRPLPGAGHRRDDRRAAAVDVPVLLRGSVAVAVPQPRRRRPARAVPGQPGAARARRRHAAGGVRAAGRPARGVARGARELVPGHRRRGRGAAAVRAGAVRGETTAPVTAVPVTAVPVTTAPVTTASGRSP
jgi:hypothetical protein